MCTAPELERSPIAVHPASYLTSGRIAVNEQDRNSTEQTGGSAPGACEPRKAYQKPSFRFEQVFETMALQCGKTNTTQGACGMSRFAS